jgi:hypothetical protein
MRILTILTALTLIAAQADAQRRVNERRFATSDASIKIYNLGGVTRVIGWDRDTIAVTGTVGPNAGAFSIGLAGDGRSIRIGVDGPVDQRNPDGAVLEIRLPQRARVLVRSATAEITVSDVTGALDLYSVSGAVTVTGRPRELYAETLEGALDIRVTSPVVRVKSAGGGIALRAVGEEVDASTVSGDIVVDGGRYRRGRFQSVTGNIRFSGGFDRLGVYGFETHSGQVDLRLDPSVSAEFDVLTVNGEIANGLTSDRPVRDAEGNRLQFSTDPGAARVSIRSFRGVVSIKKAPRG